MNCKERIEKDCYLELDILIVDGNGEYGLGSVRWNDNFPGDFPVECFAEMYLNRINKDYLEDAEKLIEELAEGKSYWNNCKSMLDAVNAILDFWFIEPIEEIGDFQTYTSYKDAFADISKEVGYKIVEMDDSIFRKKGE